MPLYKKTLIIDKMFRNVITELSINFHVSFSFPRLEMHLHVDLKCLVMKGFMTKWWMRMSAEGLWDCW